MRPVPKPFTSIRNEDYLRFIRDQHCVASGSRICVAHHEGPHSHSKKCDDYRTIPLHPDYHRGRPFALHDLGKKSFAVRLGIDYQLIQIKLMLKYLEEKYDVNAKEDVVKFLIDRIEKERGRS